MKLNRFSLAMGLLGSFAVFISACDSDRTLVPERVNPTSPTPAAATPTAQPSTPAESEDLEYLRELPKLSSYQSLAAKFNVSLKVPVFEKNAREMNENTDAAIATADAAIKAIAAIPSDQRTFENTIRAIDDLLLPIFDLQSRLDLISETDVSKETREAAIEASKRISKWATQIEYNLELYNAVKDFSDRTGDLKKARPDLSRESIKFYEETLKDFVRAGTTLPEAQRSRVEVLRKQLSDLSADFTKNINQDETSVEFTKEELAGVKEDFINSLKRNGDKYIVSAKRPDHAMAIQDNASKYSTRKTYMTARYSVAQKVNTPILEQALEMRDEVAELLGYTSWADYRIEPKMAKSFPKAEKFVVDLAKGLEPKANAEVAEMLKYKIRDENNPSVSFDIFDYYYYMNLLQREKFDVDSSELENFFPVERVMKGMFEVYARMFRLKFVELDPGYRWYNDVQLFLVLDRQTQEPLGLIYFDLYPRDGKYNHFAQFGVSTGKRLANGVYQRPVVAVVCNFPTPEKGNPSLLSFENVKTMFHEFGHALHSVLTKAEYARFSGTSVQRDFVEAPSQMLENWVAQKPILDLFAEDVRAPGQKISADFLKKIKQAEQGVSGIYMRRQMALALTDLRLHSKGRKKDSAQIVADAFSETFLPLPAGTNFNAGWGHIMGGYDAGYYGYAWADVIAVDLFTAFELNPKGLLDAALGMKLRNEIYAVGGSRDADESVTAFLGRPYSQIPYLESLGIKVNR